MKLDRAGFRMEDRERMLIEAVRDGRSDLFNELFRLHHHYLYNFMYQISGDAAKADDLTQEAMIQALRHLSSFRFESSFRTWLSRIAINLFRKECRKPTHDSLCLAMIKIPANDHTPERIIEKSELQWCIRHNLQYHLPEKYRLVLILRDLHNLSYKEISDIVGYNVNLVKTNIHRARRMFRQLFIDKKCKAFADDYMCICEGILDL